MFVSLRAPQMILQGARVESWSTPKEGLYLCRSRDHLPSWTDVPDLRGRDWAGDRNGRFPNSEWLRVSKTPSPSVHWFAATTKWSFFEAKTPKAWVPCMGRGGGGEWGCL